MSEDRIEVYQDKAGKWRWRRRGRNGRIVAASGESFASKWSAKRSAKRAAKAARAA